MGLTKVLPGTGGKGVMLWPVVPGYTRQMSPPKAVSGTKSVTEGRQIFLSLLSGLLEK